MSDVHRVRLHTTPRIGWRVPGWTARLAVALVGGSLCVFQLSFGFFFVVALVLVALSVAFPATPSAWAVMVLLGASVLVRTPSPEDPRIYLLIAGVHLLHLLASYAAVIPPRSWVQLRAFASPLRRFIFIQVPAQLAAGVALYAFSPRFDGAPGAVVPVLGAIAAAALVVLTLVLIVPLRSEKRRQSG